MAGDKLFGLVKSFNPAEKRLIRIVNAKNPKTGKPEGYSKALKTIRFGYFKRTANSNPLDMVPEDISLDEEMGDMNEDTDSI